MGKTKQFFQYLFKTEKQDDEKENEKDEIISSMTQYWIIGAVMLVLVIVMFIWNLK